MCRCEIDSSELNLLNHDLCSVRQICMLDKILLGNGRAHAFEHALYICCEGVPGHGIQALEEFPVDLWKITFSTFSV